MLVIWIFCLQHQVHLMVKQQLKRMPELFSNCAKIVNTWRSTGISVVVFQAWKDLFGLDRAKKAVGALPPRPRIAWTHGDWGLRPLTPAPLRRKSDPGRSSVPGIGRHQKTKLWNE